MSVAAEEVSLNAIRGCNSDLTRDEWAERNISLDGRRFSFRRHEYLRGIYKCDHHNIVLEKAAQVGGSVFGIIDSLWAIDTGRVRTVIYFFPTNRDIADFSHDRVRPLILECPRLAGRAKGVDNAGYKQFLNPADGSLQASIYFRGMKSRVSTSSVPADQIVIDERDKVSTRDYELAVKRISHSEKGYRREACTPTVSDYGIDAAFLRSDMRFWSMKCSSCGEWNQPEKTFRQDNAPDRVLYEKDGLVYLGCSKCAARLDPSRGEWVADFPDRKDICGFHISQLYSQVVQAGRPIQNVILDDWRNTRYIQDFWNSRIGFPYEEKTMSLSLETLNACDDDYSMQLSGRSCTMGVDQGNKLHVVVSTMRNNLRHVLYAGVHDSFDDLDKLMSLYDVRSAVIDALPNTHSARSFAAKFPGRVHLCFYSATARGGCSWNDSDSSVSVNRTESLDASLSCYLKGEVRLPRDPVIEDIFKPQMRNAARKPVREENGEISGYEWVKRGQDHFRHADNYDQIAASRRGRDLGEILSGIVSVERRPGSGNSPPASDFLPVIEREDFSDRSEMEKW